VARLVLAAVLFTAGGLKIVNVDGAARAVQAYRIFPPRLGDLIGYGLPVVEILLGLFLLLGLGTRIVAIATGALMVIFIAGVASVWIRGISIDCGCFGGGGETAVTHYPQEILRDLLFLGLASWLAVFPTSKLALDRSGLAGTGDESVLDELGAYDDDDMADYDDSESDAPEDLG
jgi:uncharacterized membrane protein YphA (DoxX/SURF4 family)